MIKKFILTIEYPDCDYIPSKEIEEVIDEGVEYLLGRFLGINIMDGDHERLKTTIKEIKEN
jgi:hypothetical protein